MFTISSILVYDFVHMFMISSILVYDFVNTGEVTFSKFWTGLRSKSKILKTRGVLEICLEIGS